jgi:signal transduction histidine kinase
MKAATTELVDLNEAARDVIAFSSHALHRNRVVLRAELASQLPRVRGSRVQLQQVILNLVLNASDAMRDIEDRPRELSIHTERTAAAGVSLTVRDSGVGFEPESLEKLFTAFYTTKTTGMGLGLSISRSIIESHHGQLRALTNDGPGAAFSFTLPGEHDVLEADAPGGSDDGDAPRVEQ